MEGGQGGRWGGWHQIAVWEQQRWTGSLKNLTTGLIWLVTRVGGWGKAWGGGPWSGEVAHGGRARGEMGGEVHWFPLWALETGLIWLVTRVGGWGEAWGGGPWRAGKGGDGGGGAPESSVGATKAAPFLGWGDGGRRGEVAHGGRARGEMGGGHQQLGLGRRRGGHQKARDGGWGGGRVRECGSGTRAEGSEVERVDKMWSGRWPGLEKGERRVWGHHDTRVVGAERQIKKKVQMRGNGEGVKGTCWAPAPGVGGLVLLLFLVLLLLLVLISLLILYVHWDRAQYDDWR